MLLIFERARPDSGMFWLHWASVLSSLFSALWGGCESFDVSGVTVKVSGWGLTVGVGSGCWQAASSRKKKQNKLTRRKDFLGTSYLLLPDVMWFLCFAKLNKAA